MIYRFSVALVRLLLRVFFVRVEVTGIENVPEHGGGLVVSWHPNAIVDGALILTSFPRRVVFGARHGLFRWPFLGFIMRAVGTVPIYRRQDVPARGDGARWKANEKSLTGLASEIAGGSYAALFPEGASHDQPAPTGLKLGAARLYYRALELAPDGEPPVILPVGLHYDQKHAFGSRALVAIHPPLDVAKANGDAKALTAELEQTLHSIVHATESWDLHHALQRVRTLMRAERAHRAGTPPRPSDMKERVLGFKRLWAAHQERTRTHPDEVERIYHRTREYDEDLRALGIHDHELDVPPRVLSPWLAAILAAQAFLVYLVLPPILVLGYLVNAPAAVLTWAVSRWASREHKDMASIKLVTGGIAIPITWILVASFVAGGQSFLQSMYPQIPGSPLATGIAAFLLTALSSFVALNYQRLATKTLRSLRVRLIRFRRKATLARLRAERSAIFDELEKLRPGLELPEEITHGVRIAD